MAYGLIYKEGRLTFYNRAGPKFIENHMADEAAEILYTYHPIKNFISNESHLGICQSLENANFQKAGEYLDRSLPPFL